MEVAVELIRPSPYQPRLIFNVEDLKEEIKRDGLLSPLIVRERDGFYELIDGERRLRAIKELGWRTVGVEIKDVDDRTARRSVFKLNKIRENYTTEEEARYYKKLADEGMTAWEISEELGVDFHWVLANLNIFKFPEDIQKIIFTGPGQLTISHIKSLKRVIARNINEAIAYVRIILDRKLNRDEVRRLVQEQEALAVKRALEEERLKKAQSELPETRISLETPEDLERVAIALKKEAEKRRIESLTPEQRANLVTEKQLKAQQRAEAKRKAQKRREEEIRQKLLKDKEFLQQVATIIMPIQGELPKKTKEKTYLTPQEKEFKFKVYNVWNFAECDDRFGMKGYLGRIPGQIVANLLYYYTDEGDLVVDPMAGSGTTLDVCNFMNRRCLAYDIAPVREDIIHHDIRLGFPEEAKDCQLIFLDPPYWRLQQEEYERLGVVLPSYEEWLEFMEKLAKDSFETVRQGKFVALLVEAFLDEKVTGKFLDLPFKCLNFFERAGFTEIQRISVPMPSEIKSAQDVEYAKSKRIMLDLNLDLVVFRKE